jgi:xanthine dehydrogenase accessory factor
VKDILPDLTRWLDNRERIALATVIQTWGSSPRGVGAKMGMTASGRMTGSVSGGCVEAAVLEAGLDTLETGKPRLLHFGVADETAWAVGLACGGMIEVFVQPLDGEVFAATRAALEADTAAALVTVIAGGDEVLGKSLLYANDDLSGSLPLALIEPARQAAQIALARGSAGTATLPGAEGFVEVILPAPELIIIGGVHISVALAALAKIMGYRSVIVDPRRAFGSPERFAHADRLVQAWPDEALRGLEVTERTAIAVLTHDPKLDDPALLAALRSRAFYVGALGSRTTQARRRTRLLEAGLTEAQLARLHAPIGLDIGAQTPEEVALAIMGEIVGVRRG